MKVLLFNVNDVYQEFDEPSHGLGYIKSYFEKYSSYNDIIIRIIRQNIWQTIQEEKPDIIGISSMTPDYTRAIEFARKVKDELPSSTIILGGIHISNLPESFNPIFDIAVIGEGEITTKELLETLHDQGLDKQKLYGIKGLIFFDGNKMIRTQARELIINLDEIPYPFREGEQVYLKMMTARGCPYKCAYCSSSKFWGWRIRYNSASYVVNHMLSLIKEHNAKHITLWDDLFAVNKMRLAEIVKLMHQHRAYFKKVTFGITARTNIVNEEVCKLLKEMNVTRVSIGIESGSANVLKRMSRTTTNEVNKKAIRILKKYFVVNGGFILGSPGETLQDLKETYNFVIDADLDGGGFGLAVPYPNTPWWDYALKRGIVNNNMDFSKLRLVTDLNNVDDSNIMLLTEDIPRKVFIEWGMKIQKHLSMLSVKSMFGRKMLTKRNLYLAIRHPKISLPFAFFWIRKAIRTNLSLE